MKRPVEFIPLPPADLLRELFSYDPEEGVLRWRQRINSRIPLTLEAGTAHADTGLQVRYKGVIYQVHRIIWKWMTGADPVNEIDHRDLNRANNKWSNLRDADRGQQVANQARRWRNKSGFKGVYLHKSGKYMAQTKVNGLQTYLGVYTTAEEAHDVYMAFMKKRFGDFARAS